MIKEAYDPWRCFSFLYPFSPGMLERLEIGALSYENDETDKYDQNKYWDAWEILLWDSFPGHSDR